MDAPPVPVDSPLAPSDFCKIWVIHGPTCPIVIMLKVRPGGILTMRIVEHATGKLLVPEKDSQSIGFLPYQCDQLEDALRTARAHRDEAGLTELVLKAALGVD